jgi:hypothetical protein
MRLDPIATIGRPAKGVPFAEPAYGSCVVRVTEHDREPPKGFARSEYARRQAFNADGSQLLINSMDGHWHLYDTATLRYGKQLPALAGDAEPQWHRDDPRLLYFVPRNGLGMKLFELDVVKDRVRTVAEFQSALRKVWPSASAAWTRSEGSPSADLRYWAFQVDDSDWQGLGLFTWDMATNSVISTYDFARNRKERPDHVSMSPSGEYVVASWDNGPVQFTRDLQPLRVLSSKGEHSDIARDLNGDDIFISVDYDSDSGPVFMFNLRTGRRTDLFQSYESGTATAFHFSGKAYRRPGWVLVSTYADYTTRTAALLGRGGRKWLHRKVFAVQLAAKPRILNLAHHHSVPAKYFSEPQASVNFDFTRIVFNSNWDQMSETDIDTYMIILPQDAIPPVA